MKHYEEIGCNLLVNNIVFLNFKSFIYFVLLSTDQISTLCTYLYQNLDLYEVEATKASFQMQLKLALAWNRIDVAKSEIFTSNLQDLKFEVSHSVDHDFDPKISDRKLYILIYNHNKSVRFFFESKQISCLTLKKQNNQTIKLQSMKKF